MDNLFQKVIKGAKTSVRHTTDSLTKKIALTTVLGSTLMFSTMYADSQNEDLVDVYHVYVDGENIGTVTDKEEIEDFIDQQGEQAEENYQDVDLEPVEDVSFVQEVVFSPSEDTDEVKDYLEEQLNFHATGVLLEVNNQALGYVKDLDVANKALNKVVGNYLPDNVDKQFEFLTEAEEMDESEITLHDLLPQNVFDESMAEKQAEDEPDRQTFTQESVELNDGSLVLDVGFSQEITFTETAVEPNQLMEANQLVKMIERGAPSEEPQKIDTDEEIEQVAKEFDLSTDELLELNPELDDQEIIQAGKEVNVSEFSSFVDVSFTEEKTEEETLDYEEVTEKTKDLYKGESRVKQEGSKGKKVVTYKVTTKNNKVIDEEKVDEDVVEEPKDHIIEEGTKERSHIGTGSFAWPAVGGYISSHQGPRWGSYHKGIDIAGPSDRAILAADNGTVTSAGYNSGGYGNKIVINHNNGYRSVYAHMSSLNVSPGDTVQKGEKIGVMGSTGHSTGIHLHFELYKNGSLVNPTNYVR
ncbi:peptidoglycan DD-metalloendopeptidase family protein [Halalkalibacillus halophilus]|uniref:peptidoglycan DD-metalloendopeptidase family protein n=1 Tax=Halalkalibacillus halophilus TaxID=392827 RepID=UPI0004142277|nr:M23 family metallopeptidase [Halalkalibacillus halophilus]